MIQKTQENDALMCSLVSREANDQLIGTARDVGQYLFMELERPWAESALQTEHLPGFVDEVYQEGLRQETFSGKFLPVAPDPERSRENRIRLMDYRRPDEPFDVYGGASYLVPEEELEKALRILIVSPSDRSELEEFREETPDKEFMVCTHQERDPCCGHFGKPIYKALRTHFEDEQIRTWQVSHIGGHRYCPNLISLPDGRYWGRMELGSLENLVRHNGEFASVSSQYRGWSALDSPAQLVEKAAFEREGWPWIGYEKSTTVNGEDDAGPYEILIRYREGERSGTYRGTVEEDDPVDVLQSECGVEHDNPEFKKARQFRLVELEHERREKP